MLNTADLFTTAGEPIDVIQTGELNEHAGPDFFNARIRIGDTLWAGNVEVHVRSSDWYRHDHQGDNAYSNIILHIVYNADSMVHDRNGKEIPVLELTGRFDPGLWEKYEELMRSRQWIPCLKSLPDVDIIIVNNWLGRMAVERLEKRAKLILSSLQRSNFNWEETFYRYLTKSFGFGINTVPFELLAKSLPLTLIERYRENAIQEEALLFGQAGLLEKQYEDDYPAHLRKEYLHLKNKYLLAPMEGHLWKFLRLRPVNFPTIRIAQLAALFRKSPRLFANILECKYLHEVEDIFKVNTSPYWSDHYVFDKHAPVRKKRLGKTSVQLVIINTVVPFLFAYGKERGDQDRCERALRFLEDIPAEANAIISRWNQAGITPFSAMDSQALLELRNSYCIPKRCLQCAIGKYLM